MTGWRKICTNEPTRMDIAMGFINERKNTVSIREEYGGIGMTPEEAIELLKGMQSPLEDYAELVGAPAFAYGHKYVYPYPQDYAIEEAIEALKEIQQYREIGIVDECREAKEKQIPIPVKNRTIMRDFYGHPYSIRGDCPKCGSKALMSTLTDYCNACGQHLKRSDPEEKCESGKEDE